jgi:RNA polymerase sigma-70 factor (ECF subfamily)
MATNRTNAEWQQDLTSPGPSQEAALADLREMIARGLPYALTNWLSPSDPQLDALVEEATQETLLRVLSHLDTFQGRSKFTTWVYKIAVRIAITELRRKRWKDTSLDAILQEEGAEESLSLMADSRPGPELSTEQSLVMEQIQEIISEELTERQKKAILAIRVHGMPVDEVARQMEMTRNALYKLLHDTRLRIIRRMAERGLTPEDVLASFEAS